MIPCSKFINEAVKGIRKGDCEIIFYSEQLKLIKELLQLDGTKIRTVKCDWHWKIYKKRSEKK